MSSNLHIVKKALQRISYIIIHNIYPNLNGDSWKNVYKEISFICEALRRILSIESDTLILSMFVKKKDSISLKNSRWDAMNYILGKLSTVPSICSNGKFKEASSILHKIKDIIELLKEDLFDTIKFREIIGDDYLPEYCTYPIGYTSKESNLIRKEMILEDLVILSGGINNSQPSFAFISGEKPEFYVVMSSTGKMYVPRRTTDYKVKGVTKESEICGIYAHEWLLNQLHLAKSHEPDYIEIPKILSILEQFIY